MRSSIEIRMLAASVLLLLAFYCSSIAQTLTVEPSCGKMGTSFVIGGSGWAEPNPVCDYRFYFDGAEFAPRQPDGLFGPPARMATVADPAKLKKLYTPMLFSDNCRLSTKYAGSQVSE